MKDGKETEKEKLHKEKNIKQVECAREKTKKGGKEEWEKGSGWRNKGWEKKVEE